MTTKPITPDEAGGHKAVVYPKEVIEAFNTLIASAFDGTSATIKQQTVVDLIMMNLDIPRDELFSKGYLNVEPLYESVGWAVTYDKPGYNESYPATFTFKRAHKRRQSD